MINELATFYKSNESKWNNDILNILIIIIITFIMNSQIYKEFLAKK